MRLLTSIKALSMVCLLSVIAAMELTPPANALQTHGTFALQTQGTLVASSRSRRRLSFRVGVRPSRYRVGGFSRSAACGKQTLTALVPPPQTQERLSGNAATVDKTATDRPTFFVHLPATPATTAQFTLQNEAGTEQLHSVKFKLTGAPGIVGIALPTNTPALKVGQKYVWQVAVACDPDDTTNNMIVSSWIERVTPPTTTGGDRVTALAEQGVWQDTLTLLAMQRYQQPSDRATAEDWAALMDDAGLSQFKQAAIVQIVKK